MNPAQASGWRFFLHLLRPHAPTLASALLLLLLQSLATLAQPWLGGLLANRLVSSQGLGALLWILFGLVAAQAALGYLVSIQLKKVSGRLMAETGSRLYAHLQALPMAWHHERKRGDVLALLTGDVYRLGSYVTGTLVPLIPLLLTLAGALFIMLRLAPVIAFAFAALLPAVFLVLKLLGRRLRPLGRASMQAWADQSAMAGQNLESLPVIKAFATDAREAERYREGSENIYATELRQARLQGGIGPVVNVLGAGVVLLLLGMAGGQVARDELGIGELVSLFLYGLMLVNPVGQLASVYGSTHSARGAMQRLMEAFATRPESDAGTRLLQGARGRIRFEDVGFAYPGRGELFTGFDLAIAEGETVAITGANGAGKSSLAHLLLRLMEPQTGRILVDGVDIREYRLASLRSGIGLVAQHVLLFNASVADNIAYGRADATPEAIEHAARAARAHDFVAALPLGYDTVVGDQGVKLSGGQKQRIALARALLKDPAILILDEATAMFDPVGEAEFIAECHDVLRQRTVILITHRPASLALADRVLRLERGRLFPASG